MTSRVSGAVTAVLGPTNTGKTHLARGKPMIPLECAHIRSIARCVLPVLVGPRTAVTAREVYDRVVALKGANQVALVTGEEKIVPPDARWFLVGPRTAVTAPDTRLVMNPTSGFARAVATS
jgi:ATP-dependent RNA helicase SUPV3L1/SUV3